MKTTIRLLVLATVFASSLFCLPAQSQTFSVLYNFTEGTDGGVPSSPLIKDSAGNLYGLASVRGAYNKGVLFKLDSANQESVLYNFGAGDDGLAAQGNLLRDNAGNFYGTTASGGASDGGIVFKIDTTGNETILHTFTGGTDGADPDTGLTAALSGNVFGTTFTGGDPIAQCGVIYKIDASGNQTILYTFLCQADGGQPTSPVTADPSGDLYGCNSFGGSDHGVLYKLDPSGNLTVLHNFGLNGSECSGNIVRDAAGNLYGNTQTTNHGEGDGVVFKFDTLGNYSVLHTFTGSKHDGANPYSGLILDNKGFLYGTTYAGGASNYGTVYRVNSGTGTFFLIHSFSASDGAYPGSRLSRDSAGNIYGVTTSGGSAALGVIFKIAP